ncbi:hypothetical protein LINPERHAP1_LOCUS29694, partial [Linum perenne]
VITYHARAYTWAMVAGVLLADRNGDHIQVHLLQLIGDPSAASTYSWGSAVLAWLYKWMPYADRTGWRCIVAVRHTLVVHRLHCMTPIRQFRFDQRVPQDPEPAGHVEELLAADFRSSVTDWRAKYQLFVLHWEQRDRHIATADLAHPADRYAPADMASSSDRAIPTVEQTRVLRGRFVRGLGRKAGSHPYTTA